MSRRRTLAKLMQGMGLTRFLERLPPRPGILVINHHRIGDPSCSRFDHGVFSATAEQLDHQIRYVKRRYPIICGEELQSVLTSNAPMKHLSVVFTFDDGYCDNYRRAFPILTSNSCRAVFFLIPDYVGTARVPWWDAIAYLVRNARGSSIKLSTPKPLSIELSAGTREQEIREVLRHYRQPGQFDEGRFMAELTQSAGCEAPAVQRRFLSWTEAAEMQRAGMEIGSHTVSHRILSQLSPQQQEEELVASRRRIEERIGTVVSSIAYPVGLRSAFTAGTEELARSAGYKACFSFYGGMNAAAEVAPTNLLRTSTDPDPVMFRNQFVFLSQFGRVPYV